MRNLRLCFLISPEDHYWDLSSRRLLKRLSTLLPSSELGTIIVDSRDPGNPLEFPAEETVCLLYHSSSETAHAKILRRLPKNVCLLCISGGTFEIEPPSRANAGRHFYFSCADLDYASWLRWLEYWQTRYQFAPEAFIASCTALQINSECLFHVERWWDTAREVVRKVREFAQASIDPPTDLDVIQAEIRKIRASFERVLDFCGKWAAKREHDFLKGELQYIGWTLDRLGGDLKEPDRTDALCRELEIKVVTIQRNHITFRILRHLDTEYGDMRHRMGNFIACMQGFSSLLVMMEEPEFQPDDVTFYLGEIADAHRRFQRRFEDFVVIVPPSRFDLHDLLGRHQQVYQRPLESIAEKVLAGMAYPQGVAILGLHIRESATELCRNIESTRYEFQKALFDHRFAGGVNQVMQ